MNKFINKYNDYCGFSNVVNNRQLLLSHFDFSNLFLVKLIYFYWMHDNNLKRIRKVEEILTIINIKFFIPYSGYVVRQGYVKDGRALAGVILEISTEGCHCQRVGGLIEFVLRDVVDIV